MLGKVTLIKRSFQERDRGYGGYWVSLPLHYNYMLQCSFMSGKFDIA